MKGLVSRSYPIRHCHAPFDIVGEITIGNNVMIGAQAYVDKDVPDDTVVYTEHRAIYKTRPRRDAEADRV